MHTLETMLMEKLREHYDEQYKHAIHDPAHYAGWLDQQFHELTDEWVESIGFVPKNEP